MRAVLAARAAWRAALKHFVEKAHYIRWMVALRENPGRCGSGRAGATAALRPGFVLGRALAGVSHAKWQNLNPGRCLIIEWTAQL